MLSLTFAAALSTAAIACDPLPGWDVIAAEADGKFLVLGESHGTREAPAALAEYVCAASEARAILVAIEFSSTSDEGFQRAWAVPHDRFEQALLEEVPEWIGRDDGVASEAMFDMLLRLHALKSAGRNVSIVAFNGAKDDAQRAKFAHLPGQEPHEAAQAENIRTAWESGAYHQTVVLVGAFHAEKAKRPAGGGQPIRPMAMQLAAPEDVVSLRMMDEGGANWGCQLDPGVEFDPTNPVTQDMLSCAAHPAAAWPDAPPAGFYLDHAHDENAFDGVFALGPITASPPAVPKRD